MEEGGGTYRCLTEKCYPILGAMKMKELSRTEQLEKWRGIYKQRNPEGKTRILDELCEQYGYHRKHAIRLMNGAVEPGPRNIRAGPEPRYEPIRLVLEAIWKASEQLCGKRLVEALPLWVPHFQTRYETLTRQQHRLLASISPASADRLLADAKTRHRRGLCGTRPGSLLREQIPIQGEVWNEQRPGFLEADSVAHCGSSLSGSFVWSLTYTDLASTWTEGRAVYNRGAQGVLEQTRPVEAGLPFALLGLDFDNGGEWLNWHRIRYLQQRRQPVQVTRSRPYHADDNAHVEQKNWMWPRQLLGYGRLEEPTVVPSINRLFAEVWGPLHNFFLPSMKLVEKWRVGAKWKRRHDEAQTAYQRLLRLGVLDAKTQRRLRDQFASLDPFALHQEVDRRLDLILKHTVPERPATEAGLPGTGKSPKRAPR